MPDLLPLLACQSLHARPRARRAWLVWQVFANERSAVIGGLPSVEDSEFFETAPAGPAAVDFEAMERDGGAADAPEADAGALLYSPLHVHRWWSVCSLAPAPARCLVQWAGMLCRGGHTFRL